MRTLFRPSPLQNFVMCMLALDALVFVSAAVAPQEQEKPQQQENEPPKLDEKQLEAKAKEIVCEGKALEDQDKLAEAND